MSDTSGRTHPTEILGRSRGTQKDGVFVVQDNVGDIEKSIRALAGTRLMVGIPAEKAIRDPEPGESSSPINNALLGYVMENGSPEKNIPARPFLVPGIRSIKEDTVAGLRRAALAAFAGKPEQMTSILTGLGLKAVSAVRRKITEGPFVPLKPATIAARARRGRKGAAKYLQQRKAGQAPEPGLVRPLIDTGQLRNAISFVIRRVK